jgi:hypothetical protein
MDGLTAIQRNLPVMPDSFPSDTSNNENLAGECRNLISVLSRKIETLCLDCSEDHDRVTHIKSLATSLTTLNSLLKSFEQERLYTSGNGVFEDGYGIEYRSVRNCDLEQWFSIK